MIYLIRHGLDDEDYIGGWSDADLTSTGIEQVKSSLEYIKNNLNIKKIYSSNIKRAMTTTDIIAKELNIKPEYTEKLRELNKGLLTGMKREEAKALYPQYFKGIDIYTRYPSGESMMDLYNRVKVLMNELINQDNALIVTHRGLINMIYFICNSQEPTMDKEAFEVTHASTHELDINNKRIKKIFTLN
jgi:probable phosphoglycerate mutase